MTDRVKSLREVKRDDVDMCVSVGHICNVMKKRDKSSSGRPNRAEGELVTEKFLVFRLLIQRIEECSHNKFFKNAAQDGSDRDGSEVSTTLR